MTTAIKRTILQTLPVPGLPNHESQLILLEFPPDTSAPPHTHPVSGISYVVSGKILSHYAGQEARTYAAGESFIDPADTLHIRGENVSDRDTVAGGGGDGDGWLRMIVAYVVERGTATMIPVQVPASGPGSVST